MTRIIKLNAANLDVSGSKNPNWKGGKIEKNCLICGSIFSVSIGRSQAKYCSMQCVGISQRGRQMPELKRRVIKKCENCGIEMSVIKCNERRVKCCSKKCSFKRRSKLTKGESNPAWAGGLSKFPYTYDWLKISAKFRKRDGYKCMNPICSNHTGKGKIEGHHIDHDKSNNAQENIITLCTVCNTKANFNREYWVKFYRNILSEKYGYKY